MEENIIENKIGDTEVVEVQEPIQYPPVLLKARDQYISYKIQELYASYGVKDSEELTSSIKGESEAEELDMKVSEIKELRDRYISSVLYLGISGLLDPTAQYEEEEIWSKKEMGIGIESFRVDFNSNIIVRDRDYCLRILNKSRGYERTRIYSVGNFLFQPDLENDILIKDGSGNLSILDNSNNGKRTIIWSAKEMGVGVGDSLRLDSENKIVLKDNNGNLHILDSSKSNTSTVIWSKKDMKVGVDFFEFDYGNNILAKDFFGDFYLLDKSKNYKPRKIVSRDDIKGNIKTIKVDFNNNILVLDEHKKLHLFDSTNDYRPTEIWSGVLSFQLDLENNRFVVDIGGNLILCDRFIGYKGNMIWMKHGPMDVLSFGFDYQNNVLVQDNDHLHILDSHHRYESTNILSSRRLFGMRMDYEGNIIVASNLGIDGDINDLSILRPKKRK